MTPQPRQKKTIEFTYGRPAKKEDIPPKMPASVVASLPLWEEVDKVLAYTAENGLAPFEEALEYNVKDFKELKKLKQPRQSLLQAMRARVKKYKQQAKIDVQNRGDRIFLVGI